MKKNIPQWFLDIANNQLDYRIKFEELSHISKKGIQAIVSMKDITEALTEPEDMDDPIKKNSFENIRREALLAANEATDGFPFLHEHFTVSLWAFLESFIITLLANWIMNKPEIKACDEFKKLKVRIGEYETLSDEDRAFHLLDLLEESKGSRRSPGIARFNSLLQTFGIVVNISPDKIRDLIELHQLRNALVHRRGIADRKLISSCPWLGLSVGDAVKIDARSYERFNLAVTAYIAELLQQIRLHFGLKRAKVEASALLSDFET